MEDYSHSGHCVAVDNCYSLSQLFLELVNRKTDAVGTVIRIGKVFHLLSDIVSLKEMKELLQKNDGIELD